MRVHSNERIQELKKLRTVGLSIQELVVQLGIPKTTVWHHVHDVRVLPKYLPILQAKRGGSAKRAAKAREDAQVRARELLVGQKREQAIALAMLYWGEGSRKRCEFINSDGRMIQYYLRLLQNVLGIPRSRIRPTMRYFSAMSKQNCLSYWSRATRIPKHEFIIRHNDGSTKCKTKYGMCRITIIKGGQSLKVIRALIERISGEIIPS